MADKATATLGGYECVLFENVEWPLRAGPLPTIQSFPMAPADAAKLAAQKKTPITLEIKPAQGAPVVVQNLWVINVSPGPNPYLSRVTVADRRYWWKYGLVVGNYNCRRNVGVKRVLKNDQQLDVDFDRAPQIQYWRWSLLNGATKYQASTMLLDFFKKLEQVEKAWTGQTFKVILDTRLNQRIKSLSIEDLRIKDNGHEAVARAISYLPEADITVDYDGTVVVFSRAGGDDIQIVKALMPELWGRGHVDLVKNNLIRPSAVHVCFQREVEVRFDFTEVASAVGETVTEEPMGNRREMKNVIRLPDYTTDGVDGRPQKINGREYAQGTWTDIDDYLRALTTNLPFTTQRLDHKLIQRAFIPQMDLWSVIGLVGELPNENGTLSPWMARLSEIQLRYRRTFELNRLWTDRFESIRAYRVATIDPQTGQRGPSIAYGDYCLIPSQRARYRAILEGKNLAYAMNRTAYPESGVLDEDAIPSPGLVSVVDSDQGIVNVDYVMDQNRTYEMVLPSQMALDSLPTADITQRERPIAMNEVINGKNPPRLSPSFKLALIVTAIPASPNSAQQLHRIVVKPQDVASLLPDAMAASLNECDGPVMEIFVGPGVEVARTRWLDSASALIENIFGLSGGADFIVPPDPASQAAFSQSVASLVINQGSSAQDTGASLTAIAQAQAAAIYASLCDRYEGSATFPMNGNVHLNGWATEITHTYDQNAGTLTRIVFPSSIPQMSLSSWLSASDRAIIFHQAQPG